MSIKSPGHAGVFYWCNGNLQGLLFRACCVDNCGVFAAAINDTIDPARKQDYFRHSGLDGTTDEATSHLAKLQKAQQAIGYSHSTKLANNTSQVHTAQGTPWL